MSTLDAYSRLRPSTSNVEQGLAADQYAEPLRDDSPIWTVYADVAKKEDELLVDEWNRGLDTLALFSGLFSAVTGAFIIESLTLMQPDYAELTFRALSANLSGQPFIDEPFVVPRLGRAVNAVWLASLLLSLSAALVAVMGKDWIAAYPVPALPNTREWAQLRQFRASAVRRWRMPEIIAFAPVLLHVSLLLFACGLALFLYPVDRFCAFLVVGVSGAAAVFYGVTSCSPFLFFSSPFRSPSTYAARSAIHALSSFAISTILATYSLVSASRWNHAAAADERFSGPDEFGLSPARAASYHSAESARALFDSWTLISRKAVAFPRKVRSRAISLYYRLHRWWTREPLDLWHNVSASPSSLERSLADMVGWLSNSSSTPEITRAVIHVLKDASRGSQVCAHVSPGVKSWFLNTISMLDPSTTSVEDSARISIASSNLGIVDDDIVLPFWLNCLEFDNSPAIICPSDLLLAFSVEYGHPDPNLIRRVARGNQMDRAVLMRVFDSIRVHGRMSLDEQIALGITLLASFPSFFWSEDLAEQMADFLRPQPDDGTFITTIIYDASECRSESPHCRLIDYLCAYLYHHKQFALEGLDLECALQALVRYVQNHRADRGHSAVAYLFARSERAHPVWTSRRWTNREILAVLQCSPRGLLRDGLVGDSPVTVPAPVAREVDADLARMIARFLAPDQAWIAACSPNSIETSQFAEIITSFVPSGSSDSERPASPGIRRRAYELLKIALADAGLAVIEMDRFSLLFPVLATFLAEEPDPHSSEAVALFDRIMDESVPVIQASSSSPVTRTVPVRRWRFADSLAQRLVLPPGGIYGYLVKESDLELLPSLRILLQRYPEHHAWAQIIMTLDSILAAEESMTPDRRSIYLEFRNDIVAIQETA